MSCSTALHAHSVWVSSHAHYPAVWLLATPTQARAVCALAPRAAQFTGQGSCPGQKTLGTLHGHTLLYNDGSFKLISKTGRVRNVFIVPRAGQGVADGVFAAVHKSSI
jgi:hypothetical protein